MKNDILQAQVIRPDLLCLTEGTFLFQHDHVVNIPIPTAGTETMETDYVVTIHIQPETVLGVRMERTEGTVSVFASLL